MYDTHCLSNLTSHGRIQCIRHTSMQGAVASPLQFSAIRDQSLLDRQRQYGKSLSDTSTHDQQWESDPWPFDLESNALSTRLHASPPSTGRYSHIGWISVRVYLAWLNLWLCFRTHSRHAACKLKVRVCLPSGSNCPTTQGWPQLGGVMFYIRLLLISRTFLCVCE